MNKSLFITAATAAFALLLIAPAAEAQVSGSQTANISGSVGTYLQGGTGGWITGIGNPGDVDWNINAPGLPSGLQILATGPFVGGSWGLFIYGTPTSGLVGDVVVTITQPGRTGSATLTITFNITSPPSLASQTFSGATVNRPYSASVSASGGTSPYTYAVTGGSLPAGLALSTSTGGISGTPLSAGTQNFSITVTDSANQTATRSYSITVNAAVSVNPMSDVYRTVGQTATINPSATGGTSPITWSISPSFSSPTFNSSTGTFSAIVNNALNTTLTFTATDANGSSSSQSVTVRGSAALSFSSNNPPNGIIGASYSHTLAANGGRAPFTFTATTPLPAGLSLSSSGSITGTPVTQGTTNFNVSLMDANGATASGSASITVIPGLTISSSGLSPITVSGPQSGSFQASGGLGGPFTYSISAGNLPAGLSLSSGGVVTGTATSAGTYNFTVSATGLSSVSGTQSFSWTVNPAVTIQIPGLTTSSVGVALSRTITTSGGTGSLTLSVSAGTLPGGISLSSNSLAGTFSTAGNFSFTIRATDSTGAFAQQSLSQMVNPAVMIVGDSIPDGWVGRLVSVPLTAAGGTAPFTFQVSSGTLPPGLSLSSSGAITGNFAAAGTYSFSVRLTDSVGSQDTRSFSTSVRAAMAPGPNGTTLYATVGSPFEVLFSAASSAGSITFSTGNTVPPPGLSFTGSGITGTPTTPGTYSIGFTASSPDGETIGASFTLVVNAALQFTVPPTQPAYVGRPFTWTPTLSGGTPPLLVKLLGSSLPAGLTLNSATGQITGTPTQAGTLEFTLEATDANVSRVQRFVTLPVLTPIEITTSVASVLAINESLAIPLTAQNGTQPYTWSLASGTLPTGLALTAGSLTGTPSATGAFTFTLRATDTAGASTDRAYRVLVSNGFTLSTSKLDFQLQPGQKSTSRTVKLDANPAGFTVQITGGAPWLKLSHQSSATPGAIDLWVDSPSSMETGDYTTDLVFTAQGLAPQRLTVNLNVFRSTDATITAEHTSNGDGGHTVTLRSKGMIVPFEAALEGPGASSYRLFPEAGTIMASEAFGLLIGRGSSGATLALDTSLVIRNLLTGEVTKMTIPTSDVAPISLTAPSVFFRGISQPTHTAVERVWLSTQSGARRYATTIDSPWLSVTPSEGTINPLVPLELKADGSKLQEGINKAILTIYLEDGRPAATIEAEVIYFFAPDTPPVLQSRPTVDQSAFVFKPNQTGATFKLTNPGATSLPFTIRTSDAALTTSRESGQLSAGESQSISITAAAFNATQSVFVSFGDGAPAVIDAIWLTPQSNCEPTPTITWLAPARGAALTQGVSTQVQALITNGCGLPLTKGSVSLLTEKGPALSLLHTGDGVWSVLWTADSSPALELLYVSPDGQRQTRSARTVEAQK